MRISIPIGRVGVKSEYQDGELIISQDHPDYDDMILLHIGDDHYYSEHFDGDAIDELLNGKYTLHRYELEINTDAGRKFLIDALFER